MMKKLLLFTYLVLQFSFSYAQTEAEVKVYLDSAITQMSKSFKEKDYKTIVKLTHPNVVGLVGEEQMLSAIESMMSMIPDSSIKQFSISKPLQLVKVENEWQALMEQYIEMSFMGEEIKSTTYLLGESRENGKKWGFFDFKKSLSTAKMHMPNLSEKIIMPESVKE